MNQQMWASYLDESNRRFLKSWAERAQSETSFGRVASQTQSQPRDRMVAKNAWGCKFAGCSDRTVEVGVTVIVKRDGVWGHEVCPKAAPKVERAGKGSFTRAMAAEMGQDAIEAAMDQAIAEKLADVADDLLVEFEALGGPVADAADALLVEYDAIQEAARAAKRAANFSQVIARKLIYRVSLTGEAKKYGVDVVSLQITPAPKHGNAKFGELHGEGVGRIEQDGTISYWRGVDQKSARVQAIVAALNVVMAAADPVEYARAYSFEAKQCMRCGDDLVDAENNPYYPFLGPTCGKKFDREF